MKLNTNAIATTAALLLGGHMLVAGLANMMWEGYAQACLEIAASLYPGYSVEGTIGSVIVGTLYGVADGFVGGWIAGWLYNCFATSQTGA